MMRGISRSAALGLLVVIACGKMTAPASSGHGRRDAGSGGETIAAVPEAAGRFADVPFGINDAFSATRSNTDRYLRDLGAPWIADHLPRRAIEKSEREGDYDFSAIDDKLREYGAEAGAKAWFVINIESKFRFRDGRRVDSGKRSSSGKFIPEGQASFAAYERFLRALIPYVNARVPGGVRYWSVDNEHASLFIPAYSGAGREVSAESGRRAAAAYAEVLIRSSRIIRELSPSAKIVFGGPGGGTPDAEYEFYYEPALRFLGERGETVCFDAFDFHDFSLARDYATNPRGKGVEFFRALLARTGFADKAILIKAGATHSGLDRRAKNARLHTRQTEADQAAYLVKRFVDRIASGVKLTLWGTIREDEDDGGTYSMNGLVYNGRSEARGRSDGEMEPYPDPGDGIPKLAYYTYKLLARTLDTIDAAHVTTLLADPGIHAYRLPRQSGGAVYVIWSDRAEDAASEIAHLRLMEKDAFEATVRDAIPEFAGDYQTRERRLAPDDFPRFFRSETVPVRVGNVELRLGRSPVFLELPR
jgi:hypothetical protein